MPARLSARKDAAKRWEALYVNKTNTNTMNQLSVTGKIPLKHATESDVLFAGALTSQEAKQNPIDLAFLAAARERHILDAAPLVTAVSLAPFNAKQTSQD
jgi:hypothetical protein